MQNDASYYSETSSVVTNYETEIPTANTASKVIWLCMAMYGYVYDLCIRRKPQCECGQHPKLCKPAHQTMRSKKKGRQHE